MRKKQTLPTKTKTPRQVAKEAYDDAKLKSMETIKTKILEVPDMLESIREVLLQQLEEIYKIFLEQYKNEIDFVKFYTNKAFRIYIKIKQTNTKEESQKLKEELYNFIKDLYNYLLQQGEEFVMKYYNMIKETFCLIIGMDSIKKLIDLFKSDYQFAQTQFKNLIKEFKELDDIFSWDILVDIINNSPLLKMLVTLIKSLIPSLETLLLMVATYVANLLSYKKKGEENLKESEKESNNIFPQDNSSNNDNENIIPDSSLNNDLIPNGFSICPVYDKSKDIVPIQTNNYSNKAIIEFKDIEYSLNIKVDDKLENNKNIGSVKNLKLISHFNGNIKSIENNIITIDNFETVEYGLDKIEELKNKFQNVLDLENLIKLNLNESLLPNITINKSKNLIDNPILSDEIYIDIQKQNTDAIEKFNSIIINLTSKENIEVKCKGDDLESILNDVNKEKKQLIINLTNIYNFKKHKSKYTDFNSDYKLYFYYLDLRLKLTEENKYSKQYTNVLDSILKHRFELEQINLNDLKNKINDICNYTFQNSNQLLIDFYKIIKEKFNSRKNIEDVKAYLISLEKSNKFKGDLNYEINRIVSIFTYMISEDFKNLIKDNKNKNVEFSINKIIEQTRNESIILNNFFNDKLKEFIVIFDEAYKLINELEEYSWPASSTIYKDNEPYRYYKISGKEIVYKNADEEFSGTTNVEVNNIKYWRKYCTIATLLSIPYLSTGIILLGAPVPLPVIYLPFTCISTSSLTIVIGLGICGIAIYPMILYVNLNSEFSSLLIPLLVVLDTIKKEFEKNIANQENLITGLVNKTIKELENKNIELNNIIKEINIQINDLENIEIPNSSEISLLIKNIKRNSGEIIKSSGIRLNEKE